MRGVVLRRFATASLDDDRPAFTLAIRESLARGEAHELRVPGIFVIFVHT